MKVAYVTPVLPVYFSDHVDSEIKKDNFDISDDFLTAIKNELREQFTLETDYPLYVSKIVQVGPNRFQLVVGHSNNSATIRSITINTDNLPTSQKLAIEISRDSVKHYLKPSLAEIINTLEDKIRLAQKNYLLSFEMELLNDTLNMKSLSQIKAAQESMAKAIESIEAELKVLNDKPHTHADDTVKSNLASIQQMKQKLDNQYTTFNMALADINIRYLAPTGRINEFKKHLAYVIHRVVGENYEKLLAETKHLSPEERLQKIEMALNDKNGINRVFSDFLYLRGNGQGATVADIKSKLDAMPIDTIQKKFNELFSNLKVIKGAQDSFGRQMVSVGRHFHQLFDIDASKQPYFVFDKGRLTMGETSKKDASQLNLLMQGIESATSPLRVELEAFNQDYAIKKAIVSNFESRNAAVDEANRNVAALDKNADALITSANTYLEYFQNVKAKTKLTYDKQAVSKLENDISALRAEVNHYKNIINDSKKKLNAFELHKTSNYFEDDAKHIRKLRREIKECYELAETSLNKLQQNVFALREHFAEHRYQAMRAKIQKVQREYHEEKRSIALLADIANHVAFVDSSELIIQANDVANTLEDLSNSYPEITILSGENLVSKLDADDRKLTIALTHFNDYLGHKDRLLELREQTIKADEEERREFEALANETDDLAEQFEDKDAIAYAAMKKKAISGANAHIKVIAETSANLSIIAEELRTLLSDGTAPKRVPNYLNFKAYLNFLDENIQNARIAIDNLSEAQAKNLSVQDNVLALQSLIDEQSQLKGNLELLSVAAPYVKVALNIINNKQLSVFGRFTNWLQTGFRSIASAFGFGERFADKPATRKIIGDFLPNNLTIEEYNINKRLQNNINRIANNIDKWLQEGKRIKNADEIKRKTIIIIGILDQNPDHALYMKNYEQLTNIHQFLAKVNQKQLSNRGKFLGRGHGGFHLFKKKNRDVSVAAIQDRQRALTEEHNVLDNILTVQKLLDEKFKILINAVRSSQLEDKQLYIDIVAEAKMFYEKALEQNAKNRDYLDQAYEIYKKTNLNDKESLLIQLIRLDKRYDALREDLTTFIRLAQDLTHVTSKLNVNEKEAQLERDRKVNSQQSDIEVLQLDKVQKYSTHANPSNDEMIEEKKQILEQNSKQFRTALNEALWYYEQLNELITNYDDFIPNEQAYDDLYKKIESGLQRLATLQNEFDNARAQFAELQNPQLDDYNNTAFTINMLTQQIAHGAKITGQTLYRDQTASIARVIEKDFLIEKAATVAALSQNKFNSNGQPLSKRERNEERKSLLTYIEQISSDVNTALKNFSISGDVDIDAKLAALKPVGDGVINLFALKEQLLTHNQGASVNKPRKLSRVLSFLLDLPQKLLGRNKAASSNTTGITNDVPFNASVEKEKKANIQQQTKHS